MGTVPKHHALTLSATIKSRSCNLGEDQFKFWMADWAIYYKVWHVKTMLSLSLISSICAEKNVLHVKRGKKRRFFWMADKILAIVSHYKKHFKKFKCSKPTTRIPETVAQTLLLNFTDMYQVFRRQCQSGQSVTSTLANEGASFLLASR